MYGSPIRRRHQNQPPTYQPKQTNDLQNDIDRLVEWSDIWKLRFNVRQCKTMQDNAHMIPQ